MELLIIALIAGLFVLLLNVWRGPQTSSKRKTRELGSARGPYHAVAIVGNESCCQAAKDINNKRYLVRHAPALPLAGCCNQECHCRYLHFEDRRRPGSDRRLDYGVSQEMFGLFGEVNRRQRSGGRRATDHQ
ncbi:hypothetical protein L9G15_08535 [Shewanella sp. A3A]|nr:hypothetical protein [Shewanella ferrihydritica]